VRGKRRLIHKNSSSKAKKARVVAKDEEEFDCSESEEEEEENIPYANGDGSGIMWPMILTMPSDSLVNYFMAHSMFVCKLSM